MAYVIVVSTIYWCFPVGQKCILPKELCTGTLRRRWNGGIVRSNTTLWFARRNETSVDSTRAGVVSMQDRQVVVDLAAGDQ